MGINNKFYFVSNASEAYNRRYVLHRFSSLVQTCGVHAPIEPLFSKTIQ